MLGSEDLHHVDTAFEQGIYQVAVLYHACLVGEYSHRLAFSARGGIPAFVRRR